MGLRRVGFIGERLPEGGNGAGLVSVVDCGR